MARLTFPERIHLVHTFFLLTVPFSLVFTVCIFAFHFLLVCLLEWETLFPEVCPFPHTEHFLDILFTSLTELVFVAPSYYSTRLQSAQAFGPINIYHILPYSTVNISFWIRFAFMYLFKLSYILLGDELSKPCNQGFALEIVL